MPPIARDEQIRDPAGLGVYERYEVSAEFYDLMAAPYWSRIEPVLTRLLDHVDTTAGPVVDVGAGSGLSTVAVAETLPDAEVIAVEPAQAMRSVLMSRLAARRDLRERVTVVPMELDAAQLPAPCAAVVALGVLGHFDGPARSRWWRRVRDLLAPGAPALVEVQEPRRVEAIAPRCYTRVRVGRHRCEGWSEAVPVDDERLRWRMTYRVVAADAPADDTGGLVAEHTTEHVVWPIDVDRARQEATAAGLEPSPDGTGAGLLEVRAPGGRS